MTPTDLLNLKYLPHIIKKENDTTQFLIDINTGVLFSQSNSGILSFKDERGNKWACSETFIRTEIDLAHFSTNSGDAFFGIDNLSIIDDEKIILQMAQQYFSRFIVKKDTTGEIQDWTLFLN